jgi:hypothetical protein
VKEMVMQEPFAQPDQTGSAAWWKSFDLESPDLNFLVIKQGRLCMIIMLPQNAKLQFLSKAHFSFFFPCDMRHISICWVHSGGQ